MSLSEQWASFMPFARIQDSEQDASRVCFNSARPPDALPRTHATATRAEEEVELAVDLADAWHVDVLETVREQSQARAREGDVESSASKVIRTWHAYGLAVGFFADGHRQPTFAFRQISMSIGCPQRSCKSTVALMAVKFNQAISAQAEIESMRASLLASDVVGLDQDAPCPFSSLGLLLNEHRSAT